MAANPGLLMTGELIVMSRLLILQSRRILLASWLRRSSYADSPATQARIAKLQCSADKAHADYKAAVLSWANPETSQFWMVAYGTMIENAENTVEQLRGRSLELPISDRLMVEADISEVRAVVKRWRKKLMVPMGGVPVPA